MGCASDLCKYVADEHPVHLVWLSGYAIDLFEVTVAQYAACVDAGGCTVPQMVWSGNSAHRRLYNWTSQDDRSNHPINGVSWLQAKAYCEWLGKRLPTEAEWERAARGGCGQLDPAKCLAEARNFPWGNEPPDCSRVVANTFAFDDDGSLGCGLPHRTREVGSKPAGRSPDGLWDMAGNVAEFVADHYGMAYYAASPPVNPLGPPCTKDCDRVCRGGDYHQSLLGITNLRATWRQHGGFSDATGYPHQGMRCVQ